MNQITVQFILLNICVPSVDSAISKVYEANPNVYNTMSTNEPLRLKQTDSTLMCSVLCVNGYNCFNFNIQTRTCVLYNSCNSSDMTVSESGCRLFTDISLEQEGKYVLAHYLYIIFIIKLRTKYALLFTNTHVRGFTHINHRYMYISCCCFFFIYPVLIIHIISVVY